jgi:hypothetical protein
MKAKNVSISLIIVLLILGYAIIKTWQEPKKKEPFIRQSGQLVFTSYALCRMDCYHLNREDILFVMRKGVILLNKSNRRSYPCPIFALQGRSVKGRYIRVLFEQCQASTRVIGCYDLHEENECNCPVS